jgi:predicted RNA methylase
MQTKAMKKERAVNGGNDEYFTKPEVAVKLIKTLKPYVKSIKDTLYIEPSAGAGSFVNALVGKQVMAYDLEPKHVGIIKQDWFTVKVESDKHKVVVGNPPFGFAASVAVKFFNHASQFADVIAFIVPRSFQKDSIKNKLSLNFHLKYEQVLCKEDSTFITDLTSHYVPCVWQVWVRSNKPRVLNIPSIENEWVEFTTKDKATHAIRRVGGKAGKLLEGLDHNKSSTYFINEKVVGAIKHIINADFSSVVNSTAGVRSISKREIIAYLIGVYNA